MKIAFLVPSLRLSGGLNVVMEHGSRLARDHDMDVTMVITHHPDEVPWTYDGLDDVSVRTLADAAGEPFDLVIATWWDTVTHLHRLPSKQYAYFVQSLEDRFFGPADPQGVLAGLTYRLGLPVITEARWIADLFEALQPEVPCFYVPNGINKDIFPVLAEVPDRPDGPLRVLVEGNVDDHIKGVPEALEAIGRMVEPTELTVVSAKGGTLPGAEVIGPISQRELSDVMARTDVVLKLSRVEGMAGPPLEGFHRGATAVITPVTGHDEYTQHGWNALVTGWDDPTGTARQLDLLALGDRAARHVGVDVERLRLIAIVLVAILTAAAVSFCGIIGFVGLVVPHLIRILLGPAHRQLVLASALGGAVLLVAADWFARTAVPYADLPIGMLTALVGGPFFFWLLRKTRRTAGGWA